MARTASTMLELGTMAPDFSLTEPATGNLVNLSDFNNSPLLVVFACNHCPYVLHIIQSLVNMSNAYLNKGLSSVWINANDVENHPDDSPEKMVQLTRQYGFEFPYLYDETQQVAKSYQAACTPDLFLFDATHHLIYRGQFDSSRPGNDEPINGEDLQQAIETLLTDQTNTQNQVPSLGCNIKWKAGNEPEYF